MSVAHWLHVMSNFCAKQSRIMRKINEQVWIFLMLSKKSVKSQHLHKITSNFDGASETLLIWEKGNPREIDGVTMKENWSPKIQEHIQLFHIVPITAAWEPGLYCVITLLQKGPQGSLTSQCQTCVRTGSISAEEPPVTFPASIRLSKA